MGAIDIFDHPLIRKSGTYITKAYIKQSYYINFADASAKSTPDPVIVYGYGKAVGDEGRLGFGRFLQQQNGVDVFRSYAFGRTLHSIFYFQALLEVDPSEPLPQDVWLHDLEVYAARDRAGTAEGFYLAGKSGQNAESHHHNDVGRSLIGIGPGFAGADVGIIDLVIRGGELSPYLMGRLSVRQSSARSTLGYQPVPMRDTCSSSRHSSRT